MADLFSSALGGGAVGGTAIGAAIVKLSLDTKAYQGQLAAAEGKTTAGLNAMGGAASKWSGLMVAGATAAGVALGLVAIAGAKAAIEFDKAFTKIAALSNASAEDIARWKDEVLALSGETARAPQELAEALFFLASAGLDASQIMSTLALSAKAAAAGLGSTVDIAKITANALNAYAGSGLTAAQVTDTLVAAIREGSAEPEEFAEALGRILPVASQAGITFDQVTASLAALSNIGLDVNEGVTAMRGLMLSLLAPVQQTQEALGTMGLTADQVRASLAEDGLIATLRLLEQATGGNIDAMAKLVPNVRALSGVFGLTSQEAVKVQAIFDNVRASTGSLGKAFTETTEGPAFKLEQAFNKMKIASMKLGESLVPVFVKIAEVASVVAANMGIILTVLLGFAAAKFVPLLLTQIAAGLTAVGAAGAAASLAGLGLAIAKLAGPIGILVAGLALGVTVLAHFSRELETGGATADLVASRYGRVVPVVNNLNTALSSVTLVSDEAARSTYNLAAAHDLTAEKAEREANAEIGLAGTLLDLAAQAENVKKLQTELNKLREKGRGDTAKAQALEAQLLGTYVSFKGALKDYAAGLREQNLTTEDAIGKLVRFGKHLGLTRQDVIDILGPLGRVRGMLDDWPSDVRTTVRVDYIQTGRGGIGVGHGGGPVGGPAGGDVPAILQEGEFVINRASAARIGSANLAALNRMHSGGPSGTVAAQGVGAGVTVNIMGDVLSADLPDMIEEGARRALVMLGRP